jgi:enamine deaminase RidA (YjgF/YER057c/UK114 family)
MKEHKDSITTLAKPLATYSHSRRVSGLVYFAGQGCRDPITNIWAGVMLSEDGRAVAYDFDAQVRGVLRNVEAVLGTEGLSRSHIVDVQVFLTDMATQFPILNIIWNEFFAGVKIPPVRTTVGVKELPGLNLVEMKVIASLELP